MILFVVFFYLRYDVYWHNLAQQNPLTDTTYKPF